MRSQELLLKGKFWVQVISELPDWSKSDVGRLVFSLRDNNIFFGSNFGWRLCGLGDKVVKHFHVDWDVNLSNDPTKISSLNIPARYKDNIFTIQDALDSLSIEIDGLKFGIGFEDYIFKARHIDSFTPDGLTSEDIRVQDIRGCFSSVPYSLSIEDALYNLCSRRADEILLSKYSQFGSIIPISGQNVQESLEELEKYIAHLKADMIECNFWPFDANDSECYTTDVQDALAKLFSKFKDFKIIELIDVQKDYGECGQVLKTCGPVLGDCCDFDTNVHARWDYLQASEIGCKLINYDANVTDNIPYETNVQVAIDWLAKSKRWAMFYATYSLECEGLKTISIDCSNWWADASSRYTDLKKEDFLCVAIVESSKLLVLSLGPYTTGSPDLGDYAYIRYDINHNGYDVENTTINLTVGPVGTQDREGTQLVTYSQRARSGYYIHIFGYILHGILKPIDPNITVV